MFVDFRMSFNNQRIVIGSLSVLEIWKLVNLPSIATKREATKSGYDNKIQRKSLEVYEFEL